MCSKADISQLNLPYHMEPKMKREKNNDEKLKTKIDMSRRNGLVKSMCSQS